MALTKKMKTTMRRKSTPKVSKAVKSYVKKATDKKEVRAISDSYAVESSVGTLSIWYMDQFMLPFGGLPAHVDKVKSFGLKVKYVLHSNSTDTPLTVRMLVLENYRGRCNTDYRTGTKLFEYFDHSTSPVNDNLDINGTTANLCWRINDDSYKVHYDKNIQLGISNDGSGGRNRHGTVWIPYKKILKYERSLSSALPEQSNLVVLFLPIETPNDTTTGRFLEVTAVGSWYYSYN